MTALSIALVALGIIAWDCFRRYRAEIVVRINRDAEKAILSRLESFHDLDSRLKQLEQRVGALGAFRK